MPGTAELFGGIASGFVGAKNQAKQTAILENYRNAESDYIKTRAKHEQAKLDLEIAKFNEFLPMIQQARARAQTSPTPASPISGQTQPQAQVAPQPLPQMMASMTNPLSPTGGQAPPLMGTTGRSLTNNNPANLEFRPDSYQSKYGAQPEPKYGRFAAFPNMEAGYNALLDQIRLDQSRGLTLASFVNKFSPSFENPTNELITTYAAQLGVTPDTPIANIPAEKLAVPILARESSTRVAAGGSGQPQGQFQQVAQQPGQMPNLPAQPQVQQYQPQVQQYSPARSISQRDVLSAAWKFFTGSELKDQKYDYKMDKNNNLMIFLDGELIKKIDAGPDASWFKADNGQYFLLDKKSGQAISSFTPPPEAVRLKGQLPTGEKGEYWGTKPRPGVPSGTGGGGLGSSSGTGEFTVTEYPGYQLPGTVPESSRTKIGENEAIIKQLDIMKSTYKPEYLGAAGFIRGVVNKLSGLVEYPATAPGGEILAPDPAHQTFDTLYNEMLGQKLHQRGGTALTQQEIMYIKNTLPRLGRSPELFAAGIEGAKLLLQISNYEMLASHLTPDKAKYERSAQSLMNQYQNQFKPIMEKGLKGTPKDNQPANPAGKVNYRFNPSTGKLEAIQ